MLKYPFILFLSIGSMMEIHTRFLSTNVHAQNNGQVDDEEVVYSAGQDVALKCNIQTSIFPVKPVRY